MTLSARQYHNLQAEACRMAEELPPSRLLDSLIAVYEAGRLLHLTKTSLIGLIGSIVVRCIGAQTDEAAPPAPPEPGMWPRVVRAVTYDENGNLAIAGIDDNDHVWTESCSGCRQEAWLLKQLYVERRFGRRCKKRLKRQHRQA